MDQCSLALAASDRPSATMPLRTIDVALPLSRKVWESWSSLIFIPRVVCDVPWLVRGRLSRWRCILDW